MLVSTAAMLSATAACSNQAGPTNGLPGASAQAVVTNLAQGGRPADSTSILKKLTTDVLIGSTTDAANGDEGPRAISISPGSSRGKLLKGQLLVCNYEDSKGVAGNGTTLEVLDPKASSQPVRYFQSNLIKGCDGAAIQPREGSVYASGFTSDKIVSISPTAKLAKTYGGKTFTSPFFDTIADHTQNFAPLYVYIGTTYGGIVSISIGFYGNGMATQIADGFATGKTSAGGALGPAGLAYDHSIDTLYIADSANNTIVAFTSASKLLDKDEIVVKPGGKTFKCKFPKTTCGKLIYSGSPLDAPAAATMLPNGNLIVANTQGTANTLVELTPAGQILDTKVVDTSSTQGVFGLAAGGTNDSNTVLFFTDTNSNTVQELEQ
jgi:hypothetical protein